MTYTRFYCWNYSFNGRYKWKKQQNSSYIIKQPLSFHWSRSKLWLLINYIFHKLKMKLIFTQAHADCFIKIRRQTVKRNKTIYDVFNAMHGKGSKTGSEATEALPWPSKTWVLGWSKQWWPQGNELIKNWQCFCMLKWRGREKTGMY